MDLSNATVLDELPKQKWWGEESDFYLQQLEGFWFPHDFLPSLKATRSNFKAFDDDILLASSMKTGSTWLKAIIPCIMRRHRASPAAVDDKSGRKDGQIEEDDDPLVEHHPNELMPSLLQIFKQNHPIEPPNSSNSPLLFRTHIPYSMLPTSVKTSGCKIVYISRDPKDVFVSLWHFINSWKTHVRTPVPINEAFESFCEGIHPFGPFHDHVIGYWKESLKRPEKILFLRYEDLKRDPKGEVKKLASFLGRPFAVEEEVEKVLWRCSLERLKSLEVNQNGVDPTLGIEYKYYFRRGSVGDWKNSFSAEMKQRLDEITRIKFEGSGLKLCSSVS